MKLNILFLLGITILFSCGESVDKQVNSEKEKPDSSHEKLVKEEEELDKKIQSNYDVSEMKTAESVEFKKSLIEIEKKHGVQWDFCTCVKKGDSINKAFEQELSDAEFDRLANRLDEIDEKCKAFRIQNPNQTPEDRADHEKKVKECLENK